jgi:biopolymer transport protein ExbD
MATSFRSNGSSTFSGINVTPLVDIMLVLLVIFMVTARLIVSQTLPMDLPKAATGGEQQIVFSVSMNAAGEMIVDSRAVKDDRELLRLARNARASNAELRAVIQADQSLNYGRVVRVMDLLKQSGIGKIAFGVTATTLEPTST